MEAQGKKKSFASCFFLCIMMLFFFLFPAEQKWDWRKFRLSFAAEKLPRMFLCDSGRASCFAKMALSLCVRSPLRFTLRLLTDS